MSDTMEGEVATLDLDSLETGALGLIWGLTSSVAKDENGNPLLARLAEVFGEQYALKPASWHLSETLNMSLSLTSKRIPSTI